MKTQSLLASAALFRGLYDNNKDIYDVIAEFIRASILLNSSWSFNATECSQDIEKTFSFKLPNAVIKTCLRKRLKQNGELVLINGVYSVTSDFDKEKDIYTEFEKSKRNYDNIIANLIDHVESISHSKLDSNKRNNLINDFENYLIGNLIEGDFSEQISHFLLANEENSSFKSKINQIEEGLILYTGIRYSPDLDNLGQWNSDLVVYLDTEHLFSAVGYNGILHKKIFDEFHSLVTDVNFKKNRRGSITLKFFEETQNEIENFFNAAEYALVNSRQIDPSKTAMISIIKGCSSKSEIVEKKVKFYHELHILNIEPEDPIDYYADENLIVEGEDCISELQEELNINNEETKISETLKSFTKINVLRNGINKVRIDQVEAIFLTENRFKQALSNSELIRSINKGIPFATNVEFLTERLWFKLNKGFGGDLSLPASFDVITKAKLVLSSQVSESVSDTYKKMMSEYDQGLIDEKQAAYIISELRNKVKEPEGFTFKHADETIDYLSNHVVEKILREKSILEKKSEEGEIAKKELKKIKHEGNILERKPFKKRAKLIYFIGQIFSYIFIPLLIICLVILLYSSGDTHLSIISIIIGIISILSSIRVVQKLKTINRYLWKISSQYYKRKLRYL